eukprot:scaffold131881_cov35-Prasinocladus_malaysianus.AAC.2
MQDVNKWPCVAHSRYLYSQLSRLHRSASQSTLALLLLIPGDRRLQGIRGNANADPRLPHTIASLIICALPTDLYRLTADESTCR